MTSAPISCCTIEYAISVGARSRLFESPAFVDGVFDGSVDVLVGVILRHEVFLDRPGDGLLGFAELFFVEIFSEVEVVEALTGFGGVFAGDAGSAELVVFDVDGAGDGIDREVAEGVRADFAGHAVFHLTGEVKIAVEVFRSEQFADFLDVDAVIAGADDGGACDADVDFLGFALFADFLDQFAHGGAADDGVVDEDDFLALHDVRESGVFGAGADFAIGPFDEGSSDVAIADETFQAGDLHLVGHAAGCCFGGIGDGNDHDVRILRVEGFLSGEFFAEAFAGQVDATVVEGTGDVGEVDPFKEAVGGAWRGSVAFDGEFAILDDDHLTGREVTNVIFVDSQVADGYGFAGGHEHRPIEGVTKRTNADGVTGDEHVSEGVQENNVVSTVESLAQGVHQADVIIRPVF